MPPVNILLSGLPFRPSTICLAVGDQTHPVTAGMIADAVVATTGLPRPFFFLRTHTCLLHPSANVTAPGQHTAFVTLCLRRALPGGRVACIQSFFDKAPHDVLDDQVQMDYARRDNSESERVLRKRSWRSIDQWVGRQDPNGRESCTRICRKRPRVGLFAAYKQGAVQNEPAANDAMSDMDGGCEMGKSLRRNSCFDRDARSVNVIVSGLPCQPSSLCLKLGDTATLLPITNVEEAICKATGFLQGSFLLRRDGCLLRSTDSVASVGQHTVFVSLCMKRALPGGKGGFGAMLRGSGSSKKTTNFDACRDLQGRRLRHIRDERAIREYLRGQASSNGLNQDVAGGEQSNGESLGVEGKRKLEEEEEVEAVDLTKLEDDMYRVSRSVSDAVCDALVRSLAAKQKRRRVAEVQEKHENVAGNDRDGEDVIEGTEEVKDEQGGGDKSENDGNFEETVKDNEKGEKGSGEGVEWMAGYEDVESSDESEGEDEVFVKKGPICVKV